MPGGQGLRHRTRDLFQRGFRQKGFIPLTVYLRTYKLGDYVDIKMNAAQQKASPGCASICCGWRLGRNSSSSSSQQQQLRSSGVVWLCPLNRDCNSAFCYTAPLLARCSCCSAGSLGVW
jgi:Ribosomal protein L21e